MALTVFAFSNALMPPVVDVQQSVTESRSFSIQNESAHKWATRL